MSYIDFILNLAGLLLWINWRSLGFVAPPAVLSLASAVKPTKKERRERWLFLLVLPGLILFRALFYWQMSGLLEWTPKLPLGIMIISCKCESFPRYLLYSLFSFGLALAVFYIWLFLLAAINRQVQEPDAVQKLVRLHLGWFGQWPAFLQLIMPFVLTMALWPILHQMFNGLGLMPAAKSLWHLARQSLSMSLAVIIAWEYLLAALMGLYFLNTYIYFGPASFWAFITTSGKNLLRPLRWLRFGKLDFAPLVGMVLVLVVCEGLSRWPKWLPWVEQRLFKSNPSSGLPIPQISGMTNK
jgi:hypothetical protein